MMYTRALFYSLQSNVPGTFPTQHIKLVKVIAKRIFKANPLTKLVIALFLVSVHLSSP